MRTGTKVRKSGRSRQELPNEYLVFLQFSSMNYLLANFGVETADNGPPKVCQKLLVAKS